MFITGRAGTGKSTLLQLFRNTTRKKAVVLAPTGVAALNVRGEMRPGRVGVWVARPDPPREDKISAIGVKLRRWVSFHGISLNVDPNLSHFDGIVPCGVTAHGVTSLVDLGLPVTIDEADAALKTSFARVFGALEDVEPPV